MRVEAEADGGGVEADAERGAGQGRQDGGEAVELLGVESGRVAGAAKGEEDGEGAGVVAKHAIDEAGRLEERGVAAFAEDIDGMARKRPAEGGEGGEEQHGVADASGAEKEDASAGEVAQRASLGLALRPGEQGAERGAGQGVEPLEDPDAGAHGASASSGEEPGSWARSSRGTSVPASMRESRARARDAERWRERAEILSSVSSGVCQ